LRQIEKTFNFLKAFSSIGGEDGSTIFQIYIIPNFFTSGSESNIYNALCSLSVL